MDTYSLRYIDRYAEQLRDTMFAKARQMMLFEWSAMSRPILPGDRAAWQDLHTSFDYNQLLQAWTNTPRPAAEPTIARVAGYALEQVDPFLGQLGNPIGIASYKPYQSTGEDFLHNYLGMIGIPIELYPEFPTNADLVLLTESAEVRSRHRRQNQGPVDRRQIGGHHLRPAARAPDRGIEDIVEARYTDHKVLAHEYFGGFGAGNGLTLDGGKNEDILFPEIFFLTNDAWPVVRLVANGNGYPLLLMDRYSKGILYIWTIRKISATFTCCRRASPAPSRIT